MNYTKIRWYFKTIGIEPFLVLFRQKIFIRRITTNGCWYWKIIANNKNKTFLGICFLHHFDQSDNSIEIEVTLFPQFWNQIIMQNAFNDLLDIEKMILETILEDKKEINVVGPDMLSQNDIAALA